MTVAISLSGGGAKGDFQVGALRYIYDQGVRPDILSATSVGSINAIKLTEGEDPANPRRGLSGLEALWAGLQRNSDMYLEEAWLYDKEMDARVRDALTGRAYGLGITGPGNVGAPWGNLGPVVDFFAKVAFMAGDGQALLKSLQVLSRDARALYNLEPIRALLQTELDRNAIRAWVAAGRRLRLAAVALESGGLRYITEAGEVIERDGSAVMTPGPLSPACVVIGNEVASLEDDILGLQEDLRSAAPGEKSSYARQIRQAQGRLSGARQRFAACVQSTPAVRLNVDLLDGVLASAAIPGIFPPHSLGDEWYVDGGVRELLPIQVAVNLGANTVYAISAFTFNVSAHYSFSRARIAEIVARSVEDLMLNEVGLDDTRVQPPPAGASPQVFLIAPDVEIHDVTTIDPGLIQINRDYGYMRAADVLDRVGSTTRRWALSTEIAQQRRATWGLENTRYGHEDPTMLAAGTPAADPGLQAAIDSGKARLQGLINERQGLGGPLPPGIDRWTGTLELHPWTGMLNDAAFVTQIIPSSLTRGGSAQASITMRNTGTTTWTSADAYSLGSQSPQDNVVWGSNRQALPNPVGPGQQVTFSFTITAPPAPGAVFQWRMVQDGNEWFGATSAGVQVTVDEPAECASIRAQISEGEAEINDLRASRDGLDPRSPVDRAEIRQINAQITSAEQRLRGLRSQRDQLGCV